MNNYYIKTATITWRTRGCDERGRVSGAEADLLFRFSIIQSLEAQQEATDSFPYWSCEILKGCSILRGVPSGGGKAYSKGDKPHIVSRPGVTIKTATNQLAVG